MPFEDDHLSGVPKDVIQDLAFRFSDSTAVGRLMRVSKRFNGFFSENIQVIENGKKEDKTFLESKLEFDIKHLFHELYPVNYSNPDLIFKGFEDLDSKKLLFAKLQKIAKIYQERMRISKNNQFSSISNFPKAERLPGEMLEPLQELLASDMDFSDKHNDISQIKLIFKTKNPILLMLAYLASQNPRYLLAAVYASAGEDLLILLHRSKIWMLGMPTYLSNLSWPLDTDVDFPNDIKSFFKRQFDIDLTVSEVEKVGALLANVCVAHDHKRDLYVVVEQFCHSFNILYQKADKDLDQLLAMENLVLFFQGGNLSRALIYYSYEDLTAMSKNTILVLNAFAVAHQEKLANDSILMKQVQELIEGLTQKLTPNSRDNALLRNVLFVAQSSYLLNLLFNRFGLKETLALKNLGTLLTCSLITNGDLFIQILACYTYEQLIGMPREVIPYIFGDLTQFHHLNFHQQLTQSQTFRKKIIEWWCFACEDNKNRLKPRLKQFLVDDHHNMNEWTFAELSQLQFTFLKQFPHVLDFALRKVIYIQEVVKWLSSSAKEKFSQCEFYNVFLKYLFSEERLRKTDWWNDAKRCLESLVPSETELSINGVTHSNKTGIKINGTHLWTILCKDQSLTEEALMQQWLIFSGPDLIIKPEFYKLVQARASYDSQNNPQPQLAELAVKYSSVLGIRVLDDDDEDQADGCERPSKSAKTRGP